MSAAVESRKILHLCFYPGVIPGCSLLKTWHHAQKTCSYFAEVKLCVVLYFHANGLLGSLTTNEFHVYRRQLFNSHRL